MLEIKDTPEGFIFKVWVQPKSSKNMVVGSHDNGLKIKLTAPPVDGAANKMCLKFLAKVLKISKSNLEIVAGHTSRTKHIQVKIDAPRESGKTTVDEIRRLKSLLTSF